MTRSDAEALVEACFFTLMGKRSFAGSRGNDYGQFEDGPTHMTRMNDEILSMALPDDIRALEETLPEMLQVMNMDVFSFGPQDLAQPMGLPGQPEHPRAMYFVSDQLFNGKRFRSLAMLDSFTRECLAIHVDLWAYLEGVRLHFSRPGKATDNTRIESFSGSFRNECLQTNCFLSLEDARAKIKQWGKAKLLGCRRIRYILIVTKVQEADE